MRGKRRERQAMKEREREGEGCEEEGKSIDA